MIRKWIFSMAVSFVMRQLAKWQNGIDWTKVKADVEARIRALVPGDWFDDEAVSLVMVFIDALQSIMSATAALEAIVRLLADGKTQEAWQALRDLILEQWKPTTPEEQFVYHCVKDCETIA